MLFENNAIRITSWNDIDVVELNQCSKSITIYNVILEKSIHNNWKHVPKTQKQVACNKHILFYVLLLMFESSVLKQVVSLRTMQGIIKKQSRTTLSVHFTRSEFVLQKKRLYSDHKKSLKLILSFSYKLPWHQP